MAAFKLKTAIMKKVNRDPVCNITKEYKYLYNNNLRRLSFLKHYYFKTIVLLFFVLPQFTKSQTFAKQQAGVALTNIVTGGLISGIGASLKSELPGPAFIKGFWKGCVGGGVCYFSKLSMKSTLSGRWNNAIPGVLATGLGSSMIKNGANNKKLLSSLGVNIVFVHIEYSEGLRAQVMPVALGGFVYHCFSAELNLKHSIATLTPIFNGSGSVYAFANNIKMNYELINSLGRNSNEIQCHELIHTLQWQSFNNLIQPQNMRCKWIYWDIPTFQASYVATEAIRKGLQKPYNFNYFEFEAHSIAKKTYLGR